MIDYATLSEAIRRAKLDVRPQLIAEGAAAERTAIVAWLDSIANKSDDSHEVRWAKMFAAAIEFGEHAKP